MKRLNKKLQAFIACLIALVALVAIGRNLGLSTPNRRWRYRPLTPSYQVDVLTQEAAYPGRVVRATLHGKELLTYRCTVKDAAIALFTMRDINTNSAIMPRIATVSDPEGHSYPVRLETTNSVFLLSVQSGFAKRPASITVTVDTGSEGLGYPILFTKIADPAPKHR